MTLKSPRILVSILLLAALLVSASGFGSSEAAVWDCPECGRTGNTGNFCGGCAHPAPWTGAETAAATPEPETIVPATYGISVWVSADAEQLTRKQIAAFNQNNPYGLTFNAAIQAVSEGEAADMMIYSGSSGGDLYCFAQDQLARLVQAGALAKLDGSAAETVKASNDAGSVAAASSGEDLYAFPLTSDNGYFMFYDRTVIPSSDTDSLEKLIADCEKAGKYFAFEMETSAWYMASFFFATGCVSEWTTDSAGTFISVRDTFDSPEGLIAVRGMKKLVDSSCYLSSSQASEFNSGAAVVVSGIWDYKTAQGILGGKLGMTDLPSFTVDGKSYHLGSYNGCKLMGIRPQTDPAREAALRQLALYLTGEAAQMERFQALAWGPSNLNDQASKNVQGNGGLAALIAQAPYSVPQGQIHGSWWDIAKEIAVDVKAADSEAALQKALDRYRNRIAALARLE